MEQLCATADRYFKSLSDPVPWMSKPFSSFLEAPEMLQTLGVLLSGLHLAKTMTVLDFGAGSCWLSRMLTQLHCQAIACDVSSTALDIGKQLYSRSPILGKCLFPPKFVHFDGRRIPLPDCSVDRIICNDAFHHVPNQAEILGEFARILKPGGIAGFSEAGRFHSRSPQSQQEMRNYGVLENDIDLDAIFALAKPRGLDHIRCKWLLSLEVSLEEQNALIETDAGAARNGCLKEELQRKVMSDLRQTMTNRTLFYLHKGELRLDSRSHLGLSHRIGVAQSEYTIVRGNSLSVPVTVSNTGTAEWLANSIEDIGVVKFGCHLYDEKWALLSLDFCRHLFARNTLPGDDVTAVLTMRFDTAGTFIVGVDLVSEGICWFETLGSVPQYITVFVK